MKNNKIFSCSGYMATAELQPNGEWVKTGGKHFNFRFVNMDKLGAGETGDIRRRTWRERLFTLPWRPWIKFGMYREHKKGLNKLEKSTRPPEKHSDNCTKNSINLVKNALSHTELMKELDKVACQECKRKTPGSILCDMCILKRIKRREELTGEKMELNSNPDATEKCLGCGHGFNYYFQEHVFEIDGVRQYCSKCFRRWRETQRK